MEPIPGKDVVNSVEMTTRRFRIIFTEKAAAGFYRTDSNVKRSSTPGRTLSNSTGCDREIVHERKSQSKQQTSLLF